MKNKVLFKGFILSKNEQKSIIGSTKQQNYNYRCILGGRVLCGSIGATVSEAKCKSECADRNGIWDIY